MILKVNPTTGKLDMVCDTTSSDPPTSTPLDYGLNPTTGSLDILSGSRKTMRLNPVTGRLDLVCEDQPSDPSPADPPEDEPQMFTGTPSQGVREAKDIHNDTFSDNLSEEFHITFAINTDVEGFRIDPSRGVKIFRNGDLLLESQTLSTEVTLYPKVSITTYYAIGYDYEGHEVRSNNLTYEFALPHRYALLDALLDPTDNSFVQLRPLSPQDKYLLAASDTQVTLNIPRHDSSYIYIMSPREVTDMNDGNGHSIMADFELIRQPYFHTYWIYVSRQIHTWTSSVYPITLTMK